MAPSAARSARTFEVRVERHLGPAAAALFPEFEVRHESDGSTVLTGALPDQAALHGALARVRDLGLVLIEVRQVGAGNGVGGTVGAGAADGVDAGEGAGER